MTTKENLIEKTVIIRSNMAGVFFGTLAEQNVNEVTLNNARKIYYWSGAACVEEISQNGIKNLEESRITMEVESIVIFDVCQILLCTDQAVENLKSAKAWKIQ